MSADSESRNVHLPTTWAGAASAEATVIQWRTAGQTFTLTGLSAIDDRSLCLPAHYTQARFEIAVLSQTDTPLLPWPKHIGQHRKACVLPLPTQHHVLVMSNARHSRSRTGCVLLVLPVLLIALFGSGDWLALTRTRGSRPSDRRCTRLSELR